MVWLYILIFILSCLVLVRSGTWVVEALVRIAQFFGWKEFVLGSILMAFSTSLPEVFIGISSAVAQKTELSFGVVIGSNIVALTLITGIGAILSKGLWFKGKTLQRSAFYAGIYGILPLLLMLDGSVSRTDGIILLLAFCFYFFQLFSQEERFSKVFNHPIREWAYFKRFLKDLFLFIGGLGLLLLSAQAIVFSTSMLAVNLGFSLVVIGAVLVAFGTSIPEIVFEIQAIASNHKKMILGNIMGSVVMNSTFVLGISAIIYPLEIVNFSPYLTGIFFTIATCLFFVVFARTDRKITIREALFLIGIYLFFILTEIIVK